MTNFEENNNLFYDRKNLNTKIKPINKIKTNTYSLNNLGNINLVLGKNGCGKSTLLRELEKELNLTSDYGKIKYITPERGGNLIYEPNVENNINTNINWMPDTRRVNRSENFRQQSMAQFRNLEVLFLREMQNNPILRSDMSYKFDIYFNNLNNLLDNIEIKQDNSLFKIYKKTSGELLSAASISSGESELISLGIECFVFEKECSAEKNNILFLDEPDVHLHPDLQFRLCNFLHDLIKNKPITIFLSTHSTAILSALENLNDTHVEFMNSGQVNLNFKKITEQCRKVLPIFGAHPLSNIFNQKPIFLVEGEDEERIWQQAIRSSNQKLKLYPCQVGGLSYMPEYEKCVEEIAQSIYEKPKAFSLRDRDDTKDEEINNLKIIKRFRLSCRASENLILSNEVIEYLGFDFENLKQRIDNWIKANNNHIHYNTMTKFQEGNYDRKSFNLKDIRNDLMSIMGHNINWETAVGKVIGKLISENKLSSLDPDSLYSYLGGNFIQECLCIT